VERASSARLPRVQERPTKPLSGEGEDESRDGYASPPLYLDRAQVRRYMGLGDTEVERAFRALPVYRLSMRRVRVRRDELIDWIETHRLDPPRRTRRGA
jgi:hypothetical protein